MKRKKPLIGKIQPSETLFYGMIAVIGVIVLLTGFLIGMQTCLIKSPQDIWSYCKVLEKSMQGLQ